MAYLDEHSMISALTDLTDVATSVKSTKKTKENTILEDLLNRKEFVRYKSIAPADNIWASIFPSSMVVDMMAQGAHLSFYSYQLFIQHFMNPNTTYTRLLLNHGTGMGKTLSSIAISLKFIDFYRRAEALQVEGSTQSIGSIFVIGFAEEVFHRDLLRYPELKFISVDEQTLRNSLRMQVIRTGSKEAMEKLRDLEIKIRRRFNNRINNGFFVFVGYKAFFNRMFAINMSAFKETDVKSSDIDIHKLSEEDLYAFIKNGKILINHALLHRLENSLIICDEVHKIYNSVEKNNWGVAIQYALDHVPTARGLFMSATPLNNSPTESIDLLNLLIPHNPNSPRLIAQLQTHFVCLKKSDFFNANGDLLPGALEKIGILSQGRISFLVDSNPIYFPQKTIEGENIAGISYLKFIRIPMSKFQYETYKAALSEDNESLAQDSLHILDIVIPKPPNVDICSRSEASRGRLLAQPDRSVSHRRGRAASPQAIAPSGAMRAPKAQKDDISRSDAKCVKNPNIGLYQTQTIKKGLAYAPQTWKHKYNIDFVDNRITGAFLKRSNLEQYSPKYAHMLDCIIQSLREQRGKMFIYHPAVHISGVLLIHEILLQNGFISESGIPNPDTVCVCGYLKKEHLKQAALASTSGGATRAPGTIACGKAGLSLGGQGELCSPGGDDGDAKSTMSGIITKDYPKKREIVVQLYSDTFSQPSQKWIFIKMCNMPDPLISNDVKIRDQILEYLKSNINDIPIIFELSVNNHELMSMLEKIGLRLLEAPNRGIIFMSNIKHGDRNVLLDVKIGSDETASTCTKKMCNTRGGSQLKQGIQQACANYRPARLILIHGEVDHMKLRHSIEKFNHNDNTFGDYFMILVGAKKIQESYDLRAVREVMVVGRPENIPTLKQVIGRAVRKNSHILLPKDKRTVRIRIFTSCLPVSTTKNNLSYEEQKYMRKMKQYEQIQAIEKAFHENAIDAKINRHMIWSAEADKKYKSSSIKDLTTFDMLWFAPRAEESRGVALPQFNSTFSSFYARDEIHEMIWFLKRLFLEISTVWTWSDLMFAIKNPPFRLEIDPKMYTQDVLTLALSMLVYKPERQCFTSPCQPDDQLFTYISQTEKQIAINSILDPDEKILYSDGNRKSVVLHVGEYYILTPLHVAPKNKSSRSKFTLENALTDQNIAIQPTTADQTKLIPILDYDCFWRKPSHLSDQQISIDAFLDTYKTITTYEKQKERFINKWERISINNMELAICDFGIDFHERLVEECIEYIFDIWTGKHPQKDAWNAQNAHQTPRSWNAQNVQNNANKGGPRVFHKASKHNFIFKMIIYYGIRGLIIWAHTAKSYIYKYYKNYVTNAVVSIKDERKNLEITKLENQSEERIKNGLHKHLTESSGLENLLKSSINQSIFKWIPDETRAQYQRILDKSLELFDGNIKRRSIKPPADLLPVGHLFKNIAKFWYLYGRPEWTTEPEYRRDTTKYVENDIIIGYDEKPKMSINVRFKIRSPIQYIKKYKDIRMVERGSVCLSKPKTYLIAIAKKLEIEAPERMGVVRLVEEIRVKLIYNELRERIMRTNIKWFYFYYETGGAIITSRADS